jgi:hypothetical protein
MILSDRKGKKFAAHFRHVQDTEEHWKTECTVHELPCSEKARPCNTDPSSTGVAKCAATDNFCRATGRIIALTRALQPLPRSLRAQLWASYFSQNKIPPARGGSKEFGAKNSDVPKSMEA